MAKYEYTDGEGNRIQGTIPDFAMESTSQDILKMLQALVKADAKTNTELQKLVNHAKEQAKNQEKQLTADENINKTLKQVADGIDDVADNTENNNKNKSGGPGTGTGKWAARLEKSFAGLYGVVASATTGVAKFGLGLAGIAAGAAVAITDQFMGLGETLNRMTQSGVGFTEGGYSAIDAMSALNMAGVDASKTMMQYSNVVQSMGKQQFVALTTSFLNATASGSALGLTLEQSTERLGEELQKRQLMGTLMDVSNAAQQQSIIKTIKRQQAYASALGVSTDELTKFTEALLTETPGVSAALLAIGDPELRAKAMAGIEDFGTSMRALGGPLGGELAQAMTEAAAKGGIGLSESMMEFNRVLPGLGSAVDQYAASIADGTIDPDALQKSVLGVVAGLSEAQKQNILAMARAGDATADKIATMVMQFEQGSKKMLEGVNTSPVQKGYEQLSSIISQAGGAITAFKNKFLQGFGEGFENLTSLFAAGEGQTSKLMQYFDEISAAIGSALGQIFNLDDSIEGLTNGAESLGKSFSEKLPGMIETLKNNLIRLIEAIPGWIESVKSFFTDEEGNFSLAAAGEKIMDKVKDAIASAIPGMLKYIAIGIAGLFAAKAVTGLMSRGISSLFGKGSGTAAESASAATGKAVESAGGAAGKGLAALGKGAGAGIGSILKGLAGGLKSFANPTILMGAGILSGSIAIIAAGISASVWMIGKVLPTLGEGLKSFNDVNGLNLVAVGGGMAALGVGMAAFGAGMAVGAAGGAIAGLLDLLPGKGPLEKLKEFQDANIDGGKIENNALALVSFSKAMAAYGAAAAAGSIGNAVSNIVDGLVGFFGGNAGIPWDKVKAFGNVDLNAEKIKGNAEAVSAYGIAMSELGKASGLSNAANIGKALSDTIVGFLGGGIVMPWDQMIEFGSIDLAGQAPNLKSNTEALSLFAEAMGNMPESVGFREGGILGSIASFFSGDVIMPWDKMIEFSKVDLGDDEQIEKIKTNAAVLKVFGEALSSIGDFQGISTGGGWWSDDIAMPWELIDDFTNKNLDQDKITKNGAAVTVFSNVIKAMPALDQLFPESVNDSFERLIENLDDFSDLDADDITKNAVAASRVFSAINQNTTAISAARSQGAQASTGPASTSIATQTTQMNTGSTSTSIATPNVPRIENVNPSQTNEALIPQTASASTSAAEPVSGTDNELLSQILQELRKGNRISKDGVNTTRDLAANF